MKGTANAVFVISLILTLGVAVVTRAGTIEGTVRDDKSGSALIGASIRVVGTNLGGSTDLDGKFSIGNVPAGTYSLKVLYSGYAAKVVTGVVVPAAGAATATIKLESQSQDPGDAMRIDDTYITAERVTNTNASILSERQRSAVIGDGISAEQIRLSPDGTSSDALKRVTGLSIVDDKFVFVRGVTDRYNSTTLNGVAVTGTDTDVDKKSFSFDLMPASLIANTVVAKTATPDLPGDFSGGLVQVSTLDFPADFIAAVNIETGYDELSSRADIRAAPGGSSDWKGQDDGSRALPADVTGVALAQALPNTWGTSGDTSRMNGTYGLALGDRFAVGRGELGFIASGTYKSTFKVEDFRQEPSYRGSRIFEYDGMRYRHKYLLGGLLNLNYRPFDNHRFSFENNYTRSAEDKVSQAFGVAESHDSSRVQTIEWDQRDLYLGQVSGDHTFPTFKSLEVDWRVSYSNSAAQEPDRKNAKYTGDPRGNYILKENYRTWSELKEDTRGGQVDVTLPVGEASLKAGYLQTKRERTFDIASYTTDTSNLSRPNRALVIEPIDKIFDAGNYGAGKFDFILYSPFTGVYDASQDAKAYYGMVETPFGIAGQKLRFAGGARVEDSDQRVNSPVATDDPTIQTARVDETDLLPSLNLTCQLTNTSNLRLGYYKSVNRPEFREMANVIYLDLDQNQYVLGNPELERAVIRNYDVRLEWFPGVGEVLAASYFYKDLANAIEEELIPSPDRYVRTWFNSPTGKNFGFEVEARKNLGFAWRHLENLVIQGNYTRVESEVVYTEAHTDPQGKAIYETKSRTMQGQAPYTVNAGLVYTVPDIGLSASFLYNRFGRRLDAVGQTRDEDIFEEPRDVFDLALTEQFTGWMRLKFTIRDMASDDIVYTFGTTGSAWERVKTGTTYAVSLSFNL